MLWLSLCIVLVFSMVLLGGAVRLTGSGLSMVDWNPIMGIIPPIGEQAWLAVFAQYKAFPEYQLVNKGMSLEAFKFIFLMEYAHRVLGRVIGLVFFLPFMFFLLKGGLSGALKSRLWTLLLLGAVQGGIGWYMVKSGLVDDPSVSQYRLALHLLTAVLIFVLMVRVVTGLLPRWNYSAVREADHLGKAMIALVLVMIGSGAFVAGTHAGFIYNTFPKMGDSFVPAQAFIMSPWWRNLFDNPVGIQLTHRILALVVFFGVSLYALRIWRDPREVRPGGFAIAIEFALCLQLAIGITTLLHQVPVALGVAHQGGALLLIGVLVLVVSTRLPLLYDAGNAPGVTTGRLNPENTGR